MTIIIVIIIIISSSSSSNIAIICVVIVIRHSQIQDSGIGERVTPHQNAWEEGGLSVIYVFVYIYIYIYIHYLSLSIYIYIYAYYVCFVSTVLFSQKGCAAHAVWQSSVSWFG